MSPANPEYHSVSCLPLLFSQLVRDDMESLLYRPVDLRKVALEPFLKRNPDVCLAADAQMHRFAVEAGQACRQWKLVHWFVVANRIETFVNCIVLLRRHFVPP